MPSALDPYLPHPDVRERFETTVHAPAALVLEVAARFDLQSIRLVHAIFWLRERLMRAPREPRRPPRGLLAEMKGLGWGVLAEKPGELIVCGAACQPWLADVKFRPIPADRFAAFAEPQQVKIAWTLEATALAPEVTRFGHETRVAATDPVAKRHFLRYWRWARFGIVAIRILLLPAIRRTAEREWAARGRSPER